MKVNWNDLRNVARVASLIAAGQQNSRHQPRHILHKKGWPLVGLIIDLSYPNLYSILHACEFSLSFRLPHSVV